MGQIVIPENMFATSGKTESEIRLAFAIFMYKDLKVSAGKAAQFAGISRVSFWEELGNRNIPINYDIPDFDQDLENISLFKDQTNKS
jgi:predicted HTH domain antitoxin